MDPTFFLSLYIWDGGSLGSIVGGQGLVLVLFLFYVNVSGMHLRSHLSFQLLTIPRFSVSDGLSPWLNSSTLGDCLPFPFRE